MPPGQETPPGQRPARQPESAGHYRCRKPGHVVKFGPCSALTGWSSAAMAKRYQHLIDTIRRDVARQVGGLLWDAGDASAEHVAGANETTNETRPDAEPER